MEAMERLPAESAGRTPQRNRLANFRCGVCGSEAILSLRLLIDGPKRLRIGAGRRWLHHSDAPVPNDSGLEVVRWPSCQTA
jgi:hypothetical protein